MLLWWVKRKVLEDVLGGGLFDLDDGFVWLVSDVDRMDIDMLELVKVSVEGEDC